MLWICEKIPPQQFVWRNIGDRLNDLLHALIHHLIQGYIPHYFLPAHNLIDGMPQSYNKILIQKVSFVRRRPVQALIHSSFATNIDTCIPFLDGYNFSSLCNLITLPKKEGSSAVVLHSTFSILGQTVLMSNVKNSSVAKKYFEIAHFLHNKYQPNKVTLEEFLAQIADDLFRDAETTCGVEVLRMLPTVALLPKNMQLSALISYSQMKAESLQQNLGDDMKTAAYLEASLLLSEEHPKHKRIIMQMLGLANQSICTDRLALADKIYCFISKDSICAGTSMESYCMLSAMCNGIAHVAHLNYINASTEDLDQRSAYSKRAEEYFQHALWINDEFAPVYVNFALFLRTLNRLDESAGHLETILTGKSLGQHRFTLDVSYQKLMDNKLLSELEKSNGSLQITCEALACYFLIGIYKSLNDNSSVRKTLERFKEVCDREKGKCQEQYRSLLVYISRVVSSAEV